MARDLGTTISSLVQTSALEPVIFTELAWPSGTVRMWTGIGPFVWGGNTFTGAGNLAGCSPIQESSDGRANGITLTLSGIPSDLISAMFEHVQGRSAKVWLGFLNSAGALAQDPPYQIFKGKMDVPSIEETGETATISISIENQMIILQQASARRWTHEDQQERFPGDLGFEYVAAINQDRPINWGQPGGSVVKREYGSSRQTY
jgi:hypothetical protein